MESHRADFPSQQLQWSSRVEREEPQSPRIKEEEEEQAWTQEEGDNRKLPVICVIVKSEDDDEEAQWSQLDDSQSEAKRCPEADSPLAPLWDGDDATSHSADTDDEDSKVDTDFTSSQCDNTFDRKRTLKRCATIQTGEKTFGCSACGETFSGREHLIEHAKTHTGQKTFSCSVCDMMFSFQSTLMRHMITHSGEKGVYLLGLWQRVLQKDEFDDAHENTHGRKALHVFRLRLQFSIPVDVG
ncbi:uncharacterized protein [Nerophis lumbriciformis]|uniref:uncharacterized protein n=1 Tax=Nerophis lumbriciformis TaxID=546530 RepID=UPI003BABA715